MGVCERGNDDDSDPTNDQKHLCPLIIPDATSSCEYCEGRRRAIVSTGPGPVFVFVFVLLLTTLVERQGTTTAKLPPFLIAKDRKDERLMLPLVNTILFIVDMLAYG